MDIRPKIANERPTWLGYIAGIAVSAIAHAALFVLVFFVAPRYLHSETVAPPAYTVKIVDNIPAGDLGTHLPKLSGHKHEAPKPEQIAKAEPPPAPEPPKVEPPKEAPPPPPPPAEDKNAVSLNPSSATPTPTPPPPPVKIEPTPEPTPSPKTTHIARNTPRPAPRATPAVRKQPAKHHKEPPVQVAKAEHTPNVQEQLAKIRASLLKDKLKRQTKEAEDEGGDDDEGDEDTATASKGESGGGPVVADRNIAGSGYGTGGGTGSAGIQQDLQFLLYYRTVQQKIKDAWIFPGGSNDLTATVTFSIGPDGALTALKLAQSSKDPAFDDSVVRAIRHAAPFPPPPDKYRSEFSGGVEASFKLGELKS